MTAARIALAVLGALGLAGCKSTGPDASVEANHLVANDSWCPEGFEQSTPDTCFLLPEGNPKDASILVYLHGMYKDRGATNEWNVVRTASKRGFAVVIPRGKRGQCPWRAELKDFFCWPQDAEDAPTMKSTVAEWDKVLWQVDALLEKGTHRRYVLAFSNGGFFADYLATQGLFQAQAYAIVNGGPLAPPSSKAKAVPMLLVAAEDDKEEGASGKMKELHETLTKSGWLHAYCPRAGGHALSADDVDAALRFFKRDADGALKASGATLPCK